MEKQIVQGDILFVRYDFNRVEKDCQLVPTKVIALGERTGHAHVIEGPGRLFVDYYHQYLVADDDVEVRHISQLKNDRDKLHGVAKLPKGTWRVTQQRFHDYKAKEKRKVVD